ncbi:MAG: transposase [Sedimentibacter sp.]
MPRGPRVRSESGIYHIIMRGINRQILFEDEEDFTRFIQTLQRYKETCGYKLYAYCLMGNHLHLLLKEGKEPLETVMRRICGSYVFWYNKKYGRIGYLFQDRFISEPVEDDAYFLTVLRYIFQNPLKAGITNKIENYNWTNYNDYIEKNKTDYNTFVLNIFNNINREQAVKSFIEFINKENNDECEDIQEKQKLTDAEAIKIIKTYCKVEHGIDLQKIETDKRDSYIRNLRKEFNLSIRQIERLTGISRGIIQNL